MSASRFAAQLRLARISDEFYDAYTRYVLNLSARERALVAALLGPNAEVGVPEELGQPLSRERLAEFVEGMTDEQRNALAAVVAGGA